MRLARSADPLRDWPDSLLLLGDQVYADETSPRVRRWLRRRRRPRQVPSTQVVSFEEYTQLYLESWTDPEIRWLLSTVPSVMIFDDHEIIDDWNTSASWRAEMRRQPWWRERIAGGLASYWVYQHLGNLDPDELAADPVYAKVASAGDATGLLHDFASRVEVEPDVGHDPLLWRAAEYRWSFALDIGRTRLVVLDTRASRVLDPAHRAVLPAGEWQWFLDQLPGSDRPGWRGPPGCQYVAAVADGTGRAPPGGVERAALRLGELSRSSRDRSQLTAGS